MLGIGDDDKFDLGGIIGSIIGTMIVLLHHCAGRAAGTGRGADAREPAV